MQFANCLKYLRTEHNMTQKELAEAIGVSTITIQNWERGVKTPNIASIYPLMMKFHVSADFLIGISWNAQNDPYYISDDEMKLLRHYRNQDEYGRNLMLGIAEMIDTTVSKRKSEDVIPLKKKIPIYDSPAAAGYGNNVDESQYEMIESKYKDADFAIRISGNSMYPYIKNGEIVYVKRSYGIGIGDVGIFSVDGATYCKQFFINEDGSIDLVSLNEEMSSANVHIPNDSEIPFTVFGKVILDCKIPMTHSFNL